MGSAGAQFSGQTNPREERPATQPGRQPLQRAAHAIWSRGVHSAVAVHRDCYRVKPIVGGLATVPGEPAATLWIAFVARAGECLGDKAPVRSGSNIPGRAMRTPGLPPVVHCFDVVSVWI
jgi:hypothetical protein